MFSTPPNAFIVIKIQFSSENSWGGTTKGAGRPAVQSKERNMSKILTRVDRKENLNMKTNHRITFRSDTIRRAPLNLSLNKIFFYSSAESLSKSKAWPNPQVVVVHNNNLKAQYYTKHNREQLSRLWSWVLFSTTWTAVPIRIIYLHHLLPLDARASPSWHWENAGCTLNKSSGLNRSDGLGDLGPRFRAAHPVCSIQSTQNISELFVELL